MASLNEIQYPKIPGAFWDTDNDQDVSVLDAGTIEEDHLANVPDSPDDRHILFRRRKTDGTVETIDITTAEAFAELVASNPKRWYRMISSLCRMANETKIALRTKTNVDDELSKAKSKITAYHAELKKYRDMILQKQKTIDELDANVATLTHDAQKEDATALRLQQAEEAIATLTQALQREQERATAQKKRADDLENRLSHDAPRTSKTTLPPVNPYLAGLGEGVVHSIEVPYPSPARDFTAPREPPARGFTAANEPETLVTCLDETLLPRAGMNPRFPDASVFSGDKTEYKPWKSAVLSKLRESAILYRTYQSGNNYIMSKLTKEPWNFADAHLGAYPEATPKDLIKILDDVYLDPNEYVAARAELETLKQKDDETVEHFLMRFRNINNRMSRTESDPSVMYDFYGKIRWNLRKDLVSGKDFDSFRGLYTAASLLEQDRKMARATHPVPNKSNRTPTPAAGTPTSSKQTPSATRSNGGSTTANRPFIKRIESPEERERLRQEGKCLRCRRTTCPGARGPLSTCTAFSEDRFNAPATRTATPLRNNAQVVEITETTEKPTAETLNT